MRTRTYVAWIDMRQRCRNSNHKSFQHYGARGIKVCARWDLFTNFVADLGDATEGKWLERIDNDRDYEPGNCRWATPREQQQNRRNNHLVTWRGETLCIQEWGRRTGLGGTLATRLRRGWDVERALTQPVMG